MGFSPTSARCYCVQEIGKHTRKGMGIGVGGEGRGHRPGWNLVAYCYIIAPGLEDGKRCRRGWPVGVSLTKGPTFTFNCGCVIAPGHVCEEGLTSGHCHALDLAESPSCDVTAFSKRGPAMIIPNSRFRDQGENTIVHPRIRESWKPPAEHATARSPPGRRVAGCATPLRSSTRAEGGKPEEERGGGGFGKGAKGL